MLSLSRISFASKMVFVDLQLNRIKQYKTNPTDIQHTVHSSKMKKKRNRIGEQEEAAAWDMIMTIYNVQYQYMFMEYLLFIRFHIHITHTQTQTSHISIWICMIVFTASDVNVCILNCRESSNSIEWIVYLLLYIYISNTSIL